MTQGSKASPRRTMVLVIAFVCGALVLGLLTGRRYWHSVTPPPAPPPQAVAATRLVALFFGTPEADGLVREGREIDGCTDLTACVIGVMQELLNGPVGDLERTLPEAAPLPSVTVLGGTAVIDLPAELVDELPGGSAGELATVFSLVNTVTVNFPEITRVQLLVAGQRATTLKGHVDISTPLEQDLSWERPVPTPPSAPAPAGRGAGQ